MRLISFVITILTVAMVQHLPHCAQGQVITAGPDSVAVSTAAAAADTAKTNQFFLSSFRNLERPGKAALRSAIIPGLGQAYNRSYWKIPVIYAGVGALGYFLVTNNSTYQGLRYALIARNAGSKTDLYAAHPYLGIDNPNGTRNLRFYRDGYRRNRDLTIIISVGAWVLNVAEAYVHAHLKEFDVSDDLSLRLHPNLINVPATANVAPGLTLTLYAR